MQKVPVGRSIAHAYEFLFGRFFQIIGTAWLPAVLYGLGSYAFLLNMRPWMPTHTADGATIARSIGVGLVAFVFALVIRAVIGISLTQEALGVRKDLTLAHFVVGPRELRLFLAQIRFYILFFILYAATIAVCVGALLAARKFGSGLAPNLALNGKPIAVVAAGVFAVIIVVWFALSMLRLAFILPVVASVEHRTRLARAWQVTRGSGWRVLIVCLVTFIPVAIAAAAAGYFLLGPSDVTAFFQAMAKAKPGNPPPVAEFYAAHAFVLAALGAVFTIINGALLAGASAAAYRTVTGHEEEEPEDDDALVAPLIAPAHGHSDEPLPPVPDHGHGDHGHGGGHGDGHGHGGHDEAHGHGDDEDDGADDGHGHDDGNGHGGHGHDDGHGHKSHDGDYGHGDNHDGHGHDDHSHGDHGHGDGHHHHAKAA